MKDIGKKIRQLRIEKGMTQDELAKKCGYASRVSINKIELTRDIPIKKVVLIAKALDVTPQSLMGWEDKEPEQIEKTGEADFEFLEKLNRLSETDRLVIFDMVELMLKREYEAMIENEDKKNEE